MSVLNSDQTLEFKTRLRERADHLRGEIRDTLDRSSNETHVAISGPARDPEDDSFSNLIVDVNLSEIDRDADELRRIDSARIEAAAEIRGDRLVSAKPAAHRGVETVERPMQRLLLG